jgi:hypothetical protein
MNNPTQTFTAEQLELQAHIKAENERFMARFAPMKPGDFCLVSPDEPDFWAHYGVFNIAQYKSHSLRGDFSDTYKDVNGFRPRGEWTEKQMEDWLFAHRNK